MDKIEYPDDVKIGVRDVSIDECRMILKTRDSDISRMLEIRDKKDRHDVMNFKEMRKLIQKSFDTYYGIWYDEIYVCEKCGKSYKPYNCKKCGSIDIYGTCADCHSCKRLKAIPKENKLTLLC